MLGIETLSGTGQAVALVAAVLLEAVSLYVAYGAVTSVAGATVLAALAGD
jgi:hypothetical protein